MRGRGKGSPPAGRHRRADVNTDRATTHLQAFFQEIDVRSLWKSKSPENR
jgi:hypothetical protein